MKAPEVSKRSLGMGYVVGTGVVLSLALVLHAITAMQVGLYALLVVCSGLVPALSLVGANYWLPRSGLDGEEVWTVAEWGGFGIAVLTLANVAVLLSDVELVRYVPGLLASSIAVGGFVGILVGALLELRRSARRLSQSNDVLNRVLRHDMRNDLNVALGHLSQLERTAEGETADHVDRLRETIDDMATTTEKARQIDVALAADRRSQRPVDVVPYVRDRVAAVRRAYPEATVELDCPDELVVHADWLLGTVLDNLVENAVVHSEGTPSLSVVVERRGTTAYVQVRDDCPAIPDAELDVFSAGGETPLHHSKGVGLWLVTWVVESYGGDVSFRNTESDGNVVELELRTASWVERRRWHGLLDR
ncbi:ATP-binding protein [Halomicroarcula sp. GCM10025817]|uniref:ATP-binding protein n=1 Tax=Haloarcula TaxID=2237 RepID=UPI0023E844B1|nr:ATP-binding protein [Halomicroarcula sp. SYNS111]